MALRIFLIFGVMLVEMILYHSMQTTCPGKFWFSSCGLKSSLPIKLLDYFFRFLQRTTLRNFLNFYMMIVKNDSLPSHTNCMSRKILVPELWPKKFSSNQIARLLFQTLTKNDFKKFSAFLHNNSRDDSLPSCTNCMPRKILADEIRGTFEYK